MKAEALEFLVCPECEGDLSCAFTGSDEEELISGHLTCGECGEEYPVIRGVPRFVPRDRSFPGKQTETVAAFGWEWQEFTSLHDTATYEAQFKEWIQPLGPEAFKDRVVLDAGCGMGRFSLVSARFGARAVLAVDASDAVDAAYENVRGEPQVHVIQADIHKLPLRRGPQAQMELIFTIGVLHHLDDPKAGFAALARRLGADGTIFAWVYGRENNGWIVHIVDPLRTAVTSRLPRRGLYVLSWAITIALHSAVRWLYRPINTIPGLSPLARILPYNDYLAWLGRFGFRHNHHVVFDHLVAPVAHYVPHDEFVSWFSAARIELLDTSWRNRNSWRGYGRLIRPSADDDVRDPRRDGPLEPGPT